MTFAATSLVHVYYKPDSKKQLIGRLMLKERQILFEYDGAFIQKGLELSPFKLPLKPGVMVADAMIFEGLFGVFNDSLPDGWGRLLLDRQLINRGLNPGLLSPLDRLCLVGSHGMGALCYEPDNGNKSTLTAIDLDDIAHEVKQFQESDSDKFVEDLVTLGGSSAGARPKILLHLDDDDWIIKFRSSIDPKDIGQIEYAYHLMADSAQLEVPKAKLFPSRNGPGFFGVKRFDRKKDLFIHMHTISGLLHADHRLPSLDYEAIMKTTMYLTRDIRECEKLFRYAVFNVLAHNRDDHSKNFSYLMDDKGSWLVSPAYDLTFSSGPSGEHCTMVMGEGKNPSLAHLLKLASVGGIKEVKALQIIDEVKAAVSQWPTFAEQAKVSARSKQMIQSTLNTCIDLMR